MFPSALLPTRAPGFPIRLSIGKSVARALQLASEEPGIFAVRDAAAFAEHAHPEDRSHFLNTVDWAQRCAGETARLVLRLARADGAWVSVIAKLGPAGPDGVELRIELDDAAAARRAEAQIRQIVEGARQAAVVQVGRRVVYSNPALAELVGYASLEEMRTKGANVDHVHPDDRAMVHGRVAARSADGGAPQNYEFRLQRIDGSTIWVECIASRVLWNGQPASLAWLMDITERKQTEAALHHSEKLFAAIFQASPDMLTLSRMDDGRLIDVNATFLRGLGYERAAVVSRTAGEIGLFVDPALPRRIAASLSAAPSEREIVTTVRTAAGDEREVALSPETIRFADQDILLTVGRDVTERRREMKELRQSKQAAELANRAKSEFLANMSHELRTPLNAIIGFSEVIKQELFGPVGMPRYVEYATDICDSGMHLLQIINDLLDLSKLDAGKQELHESEVRLPPVIEDCVRLVRERATSSGVEIRVGLPDDLPGLRADERLLKQMLLNLLTNAIKFTPYGGQITVGARRGSSGNVELAVTDTGIGMSADEIGIALTPFGQIDNAHTRKHQGTGLGLPLVRALAELHGGSLELISEPKRGTTATIVMPAERILRSTGSAP